jgi:hypothetical protein
MGNREAPPDEEIFEAHSGILVLATSLVVPFTSPKMAHFFTAADTGA